MKKEIASFVSDRSKEMAAKRDRRRLLLSGKVCCVQQKKGMGEERAIVDDKELLPAFVPHLLTGGFFARDSHGKSRATDGGRHTSSLCGGEQGLTVTGFLRDKNLSKMSFSTDEPKKLANRTFGEFLRSDCEDRTLTGIAREF